MAEGLAEQPVEIVRAAQEHLPQITRVAELRSLDRDSRRDRNAPWTAASATSRIASFS